MTTDYSVFQPIANFGNGTYQFEENNQHVYNYSWNGAVASFNLTVGGSVIVPPTLYEGLLLVDLSNFTGPTGGVAAINMQNGQLVWTATVPNAMMSQLITYGGLVIIGLGTGAYPNDSLVEIRGTGTNYVAALNFTTGKVVWAFPTLGEDMPTPVIYDGLVVWANGNGLVYALNALTGQEAYTVSLIQGQYVSMSSPALLDGSIYFGVNHPYTFDCFNVTSAQLSWNTLTAATGGLDDCSPVIWNDAVISGFTVPLDNGFMEPVLLAINATTGQTLWDHVEAAGPAPQAEEFTAPSVWNGVVYSDSPESGVLYAVNASSGKQLWTYSTGAATCNANIFDGQLWIVNSNGTVLVINPATGVLLTSSGIGVPVVDGNLVFVGQNVIICGSNGKVICMPVSEIYPAD